MRRADENGLYNTKNLETMLYIVQRLMRANTGKTTTREKGVEQCSSFGFLVYHMSVILELWSILGPLHLESSILYCVVVYGMNATPAIHCFTL